MSSLLQNLSGGWTATGAISRCSSFLDVLDVLDGWPDGVQKTRTRTQIRAGGFNPMDPPGYVKSKSGLEGWRVHSGGLKPEPDSKSF